jgi:mono/diheme cytochrome c family protein
LISIRAAAARASKMEVEAMRVIGLALMLALAAGGAAAQNPPDAERGKSLYETHCGGCHYRRLHERPRERSLVHTLAELRDQVAQRAALTGRPFTREDLEDIAEYLNQSYYGLKK